jgi:DNA-binding response OmpR family regulator
MKVLLVDDEQKFATMLSKRLVLRGIDVDCVYTGEEAMGMVESTRYDVAVLDVKMPGVGGIELRRKLSRLAPEMQFIFLTGHGSEDDFELGSAEAGFILAKPLRIEELIKAIYLASEMGTKSKGENLE